MLRQWLIRRLGGVPNEDVLTGAVKHLFNTIGENDILKEVNGVWMADGKPLNEGQRKLLISEGKTFYHSTIWRVLQVDIKYRANRAMFERSKTEMDLIAGKLWLYVLDAINTRLKSLSGGSGTYNDDARN